MKILLIGSGVIGTICGAQLSLTGNSVWVLEHGPRESEVVRDGFRIYNLETGKREAAPALAAHHADEHVYDAVIVAVRADQLPATFAALRLLRGKPHLLFLGNNPEGHKLLPADLPGTTQLAFPGISGSIKDGVASYVQIAQQPTTFEKTRTVVGGQIMELLHSRGFRLQQTSDIDGWLSYHAAFIGCIAAALLQAGADTQKLANDKALLRLMCRAVEEGFGALRAQGIHGLPRNLRILHHPLLRSIAVRYWSKAMRTRGERYFAGHIRSAPTEMRMLAEWTLAKIGRARNTDHLQALLSPKQQPPSIN